jgi:hypothetical protein
VLTGTVKFREFSQICCASRAQGSSLASYVYDGEKDG